MSKKDLGELLLDSIVALALVAVVISVVFSASTRARQSAADSTLQSDLHLLTEKHLSIASIYDCVLAATLPHDTPEWDSCHSMFSTSPGTGGEWSGWITDPQWPSLEIRVRDYYAYTNTTDCVTNIASPSDITSWPQPQPIREAQARETGFEGVDVGGDIISRSQVLTRERSGPSPRPEYVWVSWSPATPTPTPTPGGTPTPTPIPGTSITYRTPIWSELSSLTSANFDSGQAAWSISPDECAVVLLSKPGQVTFHQDGIAPTGWAAGTYTLLQP